MASGIGGKDELCLAEFPGAVQSATLEDVPIGGLLNEVPKSFLRAGPNALNRFLSQLY